jgi:hypothetical protein
LTVAPNWQCDGILIEHQCGGPGEACGIRECEECHPPPKREPKRDALWNAIYAAAFVREFRWMYINVPPVEAGSFGQQVAKAAAYAKTLADKHHEVVQKEEL